MWPLKKKENKKDSFADYPAIGGVIATKLIAEHQKPVMFMYCEKPVNEQDSGWRLFSGLEDQDYINDSNNSGIYHASTILKIDDSIADLLLQPIGAVFERQSPAQDWQPVYDFEFGDDGIVSMPVTGGWSIALSKLFSTNSNEEMGWTAVMYGRTVRAQLYEFPGMGKDELIGIHQKQINTLMGKYGDKLKPLPRLEGANTLGYHAIEQNEHKAYHVIYTFIVREEQVMQASFYYDREPDEDWAMQALKSITYHAGA